MPTLGLVALVGLAVLCVVLCAFALMAMLAALHTRLCLLEAHAARTEQRLAAYACQRETPTAPEPR